MRIALTGGGTGGHVSPALAVAREAAARKAGHQFLYLGTPGGIEADMVPREGLPFAAVPAAGLKRSFDARNLLLPVTLLRGVLAARAALRGFGAEVLLATGGFVSLPAGLAARSLGLPVVVHESNALPGLANRLLSRLAATVCLSYAPAGGLPPKAVLTGNPVRLPAKLPARAAACKAFGLKPGLKTLFVFPGSRAAHSVNLALGAALKPLSAQGRRIQILWMAGLHDYTQAVRTARYHRMPISVHSFIHDTASAYACADLVLARAGASTLAEIACLGLPSILVPYPHATGQHQDANAARFAASGAARVLSDAELSGARLADEVTALLKDPKGLKAMAAAAKGLGRADAARRVLDALTAAGRPA
jgi:UDP-N-acetylglucosamine--N-acetylmuramyl-(pentapeptide) pyrophosphoryl-undecaprenol N-acetylglucosamine transferase